MALGPPPRIKRAADHWTVICFAFGLGLSVLGM
jgi:hypothetical protein